MNIKSYQYIRGCSGSQNLSCSRKPGVQLVHCWRRCWTPYTLHADHGDQVPASPMQMNKKLSCRRRAAMIHAVGNFA